MIQYEWLTAWLLGMPGCRQDYKTEWGWWRYRIGDRMVAAVCTPGENYTHRKDCAVVSLKCDPLLSQALREQYPAILPGYYMDKHNWISVCLDGSVPDDVIRDLCVQSYDLVFAKLPKKVQKELHEEAKTND